MVQAQDLIAIGNQSSASGKLEEFFVPRPSSERLCPCDLVYCISQRVKSSRLRLAGAVSHTFYRPSKLALSASVEKGMVVGSRASNQGSFSLLPFQIACDHCVPFSV